MNAVQFVFHVLSGVGVWNAETHAAMLEEAEKWLDGKEAIKKIIDSWWVKLILGVLAPLAKVKVTSIYNQIKDEDGDGDIDLYDILLHELRKRAAKRGDSGGEDIIKEYAARQEPEDME